MHRPDETSAAYHLGLALLLAPAPNERTLAALTIELVGTQANVTACDDAALDGLRRSIPAAAALPLLIAIARAKSGSGALQRVVLDYLETTRLQIDVA